MTGLRETVREVIEELDADGGGYRTGEATDLLLWRLEEEGVLDANGKLKAKHRSVMRIGCQEVVTSYRPERAAIRAAQSIQGDLGEYGQGFEHWIYDWNALDESRGAVRKQLIRMIYPEVQAVITLKMKKASEATETANRLKAIIAANPYWRLHPTKMLGDIIGWDP